MHILSLVLNNPLVESGFNSIIEDYLKNSSSIDSKRSIKVPHFYRINTKADSNSLEEVILEIKDDLPYSHPLVLADAKTYEILGEKIYNTLEKNELHPEKLIYQDKRLTMESIDEYKKKIPEIDCIYSVGGGTILDLGKAIAYKKCPLVNVPTALTNDGLASAVSSIQTENGRVSMQMKYPNVLLCDYHILKEAPNINAGIGDIIAKYSSAEDWKLADQRGKDVHFSKTFYLMLSMAAQSVMGGIKTMGKECLKNEQFIDLLLGADILSAAAMSNTNGKTYPSSGSEHSLSHAADLLYPDRSALHGEQCGMFTILTSCLHKNKWKKVRTVLEKINAPISLDDIEIESSQIRRIFEKANRPDRYTVLNEKNMDQKLKAARKTGII